MTFSSSKYVSFGDCDPAGIVFFPSYMRMMVAVTEEMFGSFGCAWSPMFRDRRVGVPTVKLEVQFTAPAFHGDQLDFRVTIAALGRSSVTLLHHVSVADRLVWTARQVLVATSLDSHASIPWPDDIRAGLAALMGDDDARDPAA